MFFAGFKFWRVGSRKLYAVPEAQLLRTGKRKRRSRVPTDDSSDSDFAEDNYTRRQLVPRPNRGISAAEIRQQVEEAISTLHWLPQNVRQQLSDALQCTICRDIITPPTVYAHCCQRILGCKQCVDRWFAETTAAAAVASLFVVS